MESSFYFVFNQYTHKTQNPCIYLFLLIKKNFISHFYDKKKVSSDRNKDGIHLIDSQINIFWKKKDLNFFYSL